MLDDGQTSRRSQENAIRASRKSRYTAHAMTATNDRGTLRIQATSPLARRSSCGGRRRVPSDRAFISLSSVRIPAKMTGVSG